MQTFILDNLHTAVITLDPQARVVHLNPAAELMLDVSLNRIQGQPVTDLIEHENLKEDLARSMDKRHQYTRREIQLKVHSGIITVDYCVTPVRHPEAGLIIEIYPRDRLERIAREESLLAQQKTSESMIRGLAHEIKNPLGGIRGAAQLLSRELLTKEQCSPDLNEFTDIIIQEVDRLNDLLDRMLGPLKPPAMCSLNIHQVLDRVVQLITAETGGQLNIIKDYDPSIPDIPGDAERLIQAILNIARNAMQAIEQVSPLHDGQIEIKSRITRQFTLNSVKGSQKPGQVCHISVIDNGGGIPSDLAERIFYPMISGRTNGSGLGLPLSQAIISQHHGLIEYESRPGRTTFHVYLPLIQQHRHLEHRHSEHSSEYNSDRSRA